MSIKILQVGELLETTQFSVDRLIEAAWLDEEKLAAFIERINPKKGSVLHHGSINKESGSSLASAANGLQTRYFVIDIDEEWRPRLSYYRDIFQAPVCQPESRPNVLGTFNLSSFTFTPTKQARSSENLRSWRLDVTGASKGSLSGSKRDKLVLVFNSDEDCYVWQAAFKVCQFGVQAFAEARDRKQSTSKLSMANASTIHVNEDVSQMHVFAQSRAIDSSDLSVLCGQSLALGIPTFWTPDLSCLLQHVVVHNLTMSALQKEFGSSNLMVPHPVNGFVEEARHPTAVAQAEYVKHVLESHKMFSNQISDEVLTSNYSALIKSPLSHSLGWSFSDSVCSLFSELAADNTFHKHFRACQAGDAGIPQSLRERSLSDFSSSHVTSYVHSKIMPSSSGSIEHMNIMYWTDRFQMCQSQQDARAYDEAKKIERRALIWPYTRSSYNDVNEFCSYISLYLFQSARDIILDAEVVSQNVHDFVHSLVYARAMKLFAQTEDDAILCAQFQKFKPLSVHELGLEQQFQFSSDCPFSSSIQLLQVNAFSRCPNGIVSLTSPRLKLNLILDCAHSISQELQLAVKVSEADLANNVSHMTADECVTVFIYVLIRANICNLATQLNYIRSFCSKDTLFGERGYFLSTLELSTSWVKNLSDEALQALSSR